MNTDEQIIESYLNGDEGAIGVLVKRYTDHVFNFVRQYIKDSEAAEDLTQDVFMRVWKNLKKFDTKKNFKPWLFQIARNATVDYFRKKKEIPFSDMEQEREFDVVDDSADAEEILEKKSTEAKVKEATAKLPEKYKTVVFLYYQQGFNLREIAEILKEPLDTVKSRHRRALISLKKELSGSRTKKAN